MDVTPRRCRDTCLPVSNGGASAVCRQPRLAPAASSRLHTLAAVSPRKSADYKQVPVQFDGTQHHSETAPTSLGKEVLRSDERHQQPASGTEPPQAKTAHRCGHTTEGPRLVGPVRQPQGLQRQSANAHPDTGRHYHYQPKNKDSGQPLELDPSTIRKHLAGWITIGLSTPSTLNRNVVNGSPSMPTMTTRSSTWAN